MIKDFQVNPTVFDSKSMLDENNFYHQHNASVSKLSKKITYMLGNSSSMYPISFMTGSEIARKGSMEELENLQFTYPVMGRGDKASVVARTTNTNPNTGKGNSTFEVIFDSNWIKRYYVIVSSRGIQAYVSKDPEIAEGGGYTYTLQLHSAGDEEACPLSELQQGSLWIGLNVQVSESESRGSESNMVAPGSWKNQMGVIRASTSWGGNSANRVMDIQVQSDKGISTNVWMDFFMWQFEKNWLSDCENAYWYSQYNRRSDGTVSTKDVVTGREVPTGSGLLEQIQNKSTYSKLTYSTLMNKIGDAYFGQDDTADQSISVHTGTGGAREIHRVCMEHGATVLGAMGAGNVADKFITGSGRNLALGGFFNTIYHIDGYTIRVKINNIFNKGKVALVSPEHPESGLPLESYRLVFIDDAVYDGQPNIKCVTQKGRSFLHGIIPGMSPIPKSLGAMGKFNLSDSTLNAIATDVDSSSYTRLSVRGIQILRANKCFDLRCVLEN